MDSGMIEGCWYSLFAIRDLYSWSGSVVDWSVSSFCNSRKKVLHCFVLFFCFILFRFFWKPRLLIALPNLRRFAIEQQKRESVESELFHNEEIRAASVALCCVHVHVSGWFFIYNWKFRFHCAPISIRFHAHLIILPFSLTSVVSSLSVQKKKIISAAKNTHCKNNDANHNNTHRKIVVGRSPFHCACNCWEECNWSRLNN